MMIAVSEVVHTEYRRRIQRLQATRCEVVDMNSITGRGLICLHDWCRRPDSLESQSAGSVYGRYPQHDALAVVFVAPGA